MASLPANQQPPHRTALDPIVIAISLGCEWELFLLQFSAEAVCGGHRLLLVSGGEVGEESAEGYLEHIVAKLEDQKTTSKMAMAGLIVAKGVAEVDGVADEEGGEDELVAMKLQRPKPKVEAGVVA